MTLPNGFVHSGIGAPDGPCTHDACECHFYLGVERRRVEKQSRAEPTITSDVCEFCEVDGYGQHSPRCPIVLEARIAELEALVRRFVGAATSQWDWAGNELIKRAVKDAESLLPSTEKKDAV